jgi:hypothetical protein
MTAELHLGYCELIECIEIGMAVAKWIAQKVELLEEGARCHMASNEAVKEYYWAYNFFLEARRFI